MSGETTLAQVAQRLGMSESALRAANPSLNPAKLSPGAEVFTGKAFSLSSFQSAGQTSSQPSGVQGRSGDAQMEALMRKQQVQGGIDLSGFASPGELKSVADMGQGYDPITGLTMITNEQITMEMLTGECTQEMLAKMKDPAAFLNARKEILHRPTNAVHIDMYTGDATAVNPADMATKAAADMMRQRLLELGMNSAISPELPKISQIDYKDDNRRHWALGGMNVGRLMERYAMYPKETADAMTLDELRTNGLTAS
jgi:hypothetical protein